MPIARIPFGDQQASGLDELAGASPLAMNVVKDQTGLMRRRPCLKPYAGAPSTVIDANGLCGIFGTDTGELYAVGSGVADRPIYRVTSSGAAALGAAPQTLRGSKRPVFAQTEMLVVIAGGELMEKIVRAAGTADRLGGTPPHASHVISMAQRLWANDMVIDRSCVRFTDVATGTTDYSNLEQWNFGGVGLSGYFPTTAASDHLVAIYKSSAELFAFSTGTTEVYQPDSQTYYARVACQEVGCAAPYSVVKVDQEFFWLDHHHRFIASNGRTYRVLSDTIQRTLEDITTVDDCFGYMVHVGAYNLVVWTFPTDGRTFVLNDGSGWGQWSGPGMTPFAANCCCFVEATSDQVVGTLDGRIGVFDLGVQTDLGSEVSAYVKTGYLDRERGGGSDEPSGAGSRVKTCKCVTLRLRRGSSARSYSQEAFLKYKDRPGDDWTVLPVDLGVSGDTEPVVQFRSLGTYRCRQWCFEFSGSDDLALVSATEDYTVGKF
jgi:hypothetical protein